MPYIKHLLSHTSRAKQRSFAALTIHPVKYLCHFTPKKCQNYGTRSIMIYYFLFFQTEYYYTQSNRISNNKKYVHSTKYLGVALFQRKTCDTLLRKTKYDWKTRLSTTSKSTEQKNQQQTNNPRQGARSAYLLVINIL